MADQNFDLIWGQNSPLAPYEFSDADYREGWEFVRRTPPTKGMFDAVQQRNDLKAQNLNRRLSAMEGGWDMTGKDWIRAYGNKHVYTAGVMKADGGFQGNLTGNAATATNASKVGGHTVNSDVPANAVFTDTTYTNATTTAAGLMSAADKVKADAVVHSAEAHNGIYRGKDLTSYFNSGGMSAAIANGTFDDIYIGDFITRTINLPAITYTNKAGNTVTQEAQTFANAKFYIAGINSHLKAGDTSTTVNHVVLISANTLQRHVAMNPAKDATGGYLGSDMWRVHIPNWVAAIKAAFGEGHVLKHREVLSNTLNATDASAAGGGWMGSATGWAWADVEVNIPNETMIYGCHPNSSSSRDVGDWPQQLPLFAHKQYIGGDDRSWFWLRAVVAATGFAIANGTGSSDVLSAWFATDDGGIRPYFLFY